MIQYHLDYYYNDGKKFGEHEIIQLGRLLGNSDTWSGPHVQKDYYELTIVTNGEGVVKSNNVPTSVKEGDIYLSLPSDIHEIQTSVEKPIEYDFFTFRTKNFTLKNGLSVLSERVLDPTKRVITDRRINFLVSNAIKEVEKGGEYSDMIIESICTQVISYLIEDFSYLNSGTEPYKTDAATNLCYKIMNYVDINLFSLKNLNQLASITSYNYSYLSTLFKSTTGKTINEYYRNKKLQVAKDLLEEGKLKANEISELLNYSSYFAFSNAFKQKFKVSPNGYKKHCKT